MSHSGQQAVTDNEICSASEDLPAIEPLRVRFQRGVFWSVAAAVATSGFNFIVNIIVARLLGREGFGQFGMVQSTIATIAGIAQLAMGYTATKFVAEFRSSDPARAGRIIGLSSVVSVVTGSVAAVALFLSAPWLAASSLKSPQLTGSLQLASVMVFFTVLVGYQIGTLAGLERYRSLALIGLATGGMNVVFAAAGAHIAGLDGAIGGIALASCAQWIVCRYVIDIECQREAIPVTRYGMVAERSAFLSFALPAALVGFSSMPALWFANALLVRQADGFAAMALYTAAYNLRSLVFFLPSLMNRVTMSLLNQQKGVRNWVGYKRVFRTNLAVTAGSVGIASGVVALFGSWGLSMFGRGFTIGYSVLLVLLFSAIIETVMSSMYQVVQAEARMWTSMFLIAMPRDLSIIVVAYLMCPKYGALGLATATTVGIAIACITTAAIVMRIGIGPRRDTALTTE